MPPTPSEASAEAQTHILGRRCKPRPSLADTRRPAIVSMRQLSVALGKSTEATRQFIADNNVRIHSANGTDYANAADIRKSFCDE